MASYPRPDDLGRIIADLSARIAALEHPAAVRAGTATLSAGSANVYSPAITPDSTIIVAYYQLSGSGGFTPGVLVNDHSTPGRMNVVAVNGTGTDNSIFCWAIVD